ncbi:hypothetical protein ACLI09_17860 [Flavobacterium sp. RHBU_24]|uniref:hypothetical protein n=1 Tax=Flavobacterium sp. RHBU_24 TaxID=3391185 RepID=UPI003985143B
MYINIFNSLIFLKQESCKIILLFFLPAYVFLSSNLYDYAKRKSKTLCFEKNVLLTEKGSLTKEIEEVYEFPQLESKANIIEFLINSKSKILNTKIENFPIGYIKNYVLIPSYLPIDAPHPSFALHLKIFDKEKFLFAIRVDEEDKLISSLNKEYTKTKRLIQSYHIENMNVKNGSKWYALNILPYSINIFFNDNMVPKSHLANYVYFIHYVIVFGVLFAILVTSIDGIKVRRQVSFKDIKELAAKIMQ